MDDSLLTSNLRTRWETYVYKITQFDWLTAFQNSFSRKQAEYTKRDNIYSATKLWNTEIPIQLKQSTSLKVFKRYKNSLPVLKHLMMCIFFLYYWILYSSLHLSQLKKTLTAYTVYLHFAAFWLVKWLSRSFEKVRLHLRLALGICNTYSMFTNSWFILYYNEFNRKMGYQQALLVSRKRETQVGIGNGI